MIGKSLADTRHHLKIFLSNLNKIHPRGEHRTLWSYLIVVLPQYHIPPRRRKKKKKYGIKMINL